MKILIVGCSYVGLTTGSAFAFLGHKVMLLDNNIDKILGLRNGVIPIHEHGLKELIHESANNLNFISNWDEFDPSVDIVFIAVGTPDKGNGDVDLSYIEDVAWNIGRRLNQLSDLVIIVKSTVPIGTNYKVKKIIEDEVAKNNVSASIEFVSNPEFLREGQALTDTFYPDRIVVGVDSVKGKERLLELYQPITEQKFTPPQSIARLDSFIRPSLIITNITSAELIKYAANSFLAMKISFINEFSSLSELIGADINEVAKGVGLDKRIGSSFLNAGIGWGGSCFGKDTAAIIFIASQLGCDMPLIEATRKINYKQRGRIIRILKDTLKDLKGTTVGILGLSFKPNTDDLRDAPSIDIIRELLELGANIKVYDPVAMNNFEKQFSDIKVNCCSGVEELFKDSDAVVLITEWSEFLELPYIDLSKEMKIKIIVDGRNILDKEYFKKSDILFRSIGGGANR